MSDEDRNNNTHLLKVISSIRLGYSEYLSYLCNVSETTIENEIKRCVFTNLLNNIDELLEKELEEI